MQSFEHDNTKPIMIDSPYFRFIYALKAPETKRQYPKRLEVTGGPKIIDPLV